MRVTRVNEPQTGMKKQVIRSALTGGALTAGVITASQAYNFAVKHDAMTKMINEYGGKVPYFKNFLIGAATMSALSMILSGIVSFIAEKVSPIDPPNAAN